MVIRRVLSSRTTRSTLSAHVSSTPPNVVARGRRRPPLSSRRKLGTTPRPRVTVDAACDWPDRPFCAAPLPATSLPCSTSLAPAFCAASHFFSVVLCTPSQLYSRTQCPSDVARLSWRIRIFF
ncbi:hypothetical protein VTK26DRAFT_7383 [Humicola hyalothermophila]